MSNPDRYHPFRRRVITAENLPPELGELRRKQWRGVMSDETRKTCDVCGGSRFSVVHFSRRAWGPFASTFTEYRFGA